MRIIKIVKQKIQVFIFPIKAFLYGTFRHLNIVGGGNNAVCRLSVASCGNKNKLILGKNVRLHNVHIKIFGNNNVICIADNNSVNNVSFAVEDSCNTISIGEDAYIGGGTLIAALEGTRITIGSKGMIAGNCELRTSDSHSLLGLDGQRTNHAGDIVIGDHVWIAGGCIILKGSVVLDNCVVAARSLVTNRLRSGKNMLIGGCPAKVIKENVNWDIKKI